MVPLPTRRRWFAALTSGFAIGVGGNSLLAQDNNNLQDLLRSVPTVESLPPNGEKLSEEASRAEHQKSLVDVRELASMARSLQEELEREGRLVLSLGTLKNLNDIEKLTKRIRARLRH